MASDPRERAKVLANGLRLACIAAEGVPPSMRGRVSEGCAQVPTNILRQIADVLSALSALSAQPSGEPVSTAYQLPSGDGEREPDSRSGWTRRERLFARCLDRIREHHPEVYQWAMNQGAMR